MDEEEIETIWNSTFESQFDCEWSELSACGIDQILRFARALIQADRKSRGEHERS